MNTHQWALSFRDPTTGLVKVVLRRETKPEEAVTAVAGQFKLRNNDIVTVRETARFGVTYKVQMYKVTEVVLNDGSDYL